MTNFFVFLCLLFFRLGEALKYDKNFKGPLSKRSCTDVFCLLIFIVFLCSWGFVGHYGKSFTSITLLLSAQTYKLSSPLFPLRQSHYLALRNGDLDRLLVPTDSNGRKCGVDNEVVNKPFLVFFNLERCIDPQTPITGCRTPQGIFDWNEFITFVKHV